MKLRIWIAMLFLCLLLSARAVTVITPKDSTEALNRARRAASELQLGHYGMIPISADLIADGEYPVTVQSTSPYFKVAEAELQVTNEGLTADITINSLSYDKVRMEDEEIEGAQLNGRTVFHISVPALNMPFDCAAHSVKRDQWYDRQLLVDAASLPGNALPFELPDYAILEKALLNYGDAETEVPSSTLSEPEPMSLSMKDGEYAIEVTLTGGSGRASVSSPTVLIVRDGKAWARLLWSSAYYDYMLIDGTRYENLSQGGNSTFEIPVTAMDTPLPVIADTTAMGDPVEIQYHLTFYRETIGDKSQVPQEAAKQVLMISLGIIVVGGILNHINKRRRLKA